MNSVSLFMNSQKDPFALNYFQILFRKLCGIFLLIMISLLVCFIAYSFRAISIVSANSTAIKLWQFSLSRELPVGEYLAALSLFGSAVVVTMGWYLNEQQKRGQYEKEYADKIRNSASTTLAGIERWKNLVCQYFLIDADLLFEETDKLFRKGNDKDKAASFIWKNLVKSRKKLTREISNRHFELSYQDLLGYPPTSNNDLVKNFQYIDQLVYKNFLNSVDGDISHIYKLDENKEIEKNTNELGRRLRHTSDLTCFEYEYLIEGITNQFRNIVIQLMNADDKIIYNKKIKIAQEIKASTAQKAQDEALKGLVYRHRRKYEEACNHYRRALQFEQSKSIKAGLALSYRACHKEVHADRIIQSL